MKTKISKKWFLLDIITIFFFLIVIMFSFYYGNQYVKEQHIGKGEQYSSFSSKPIENTIKIIFLVVFMVSLFAIVILFIFNILYLKSYINELIFK